ncbi:hypothetical protein DENSPDRAFT_837880 [Dentipellis sp. KUC8613]|nr:hypothetical protein DENSPDRAFT_837880 [Dentipellis sp. KUC8613]
MGSVFSVIGIGIVAIVGTIFALLETIIIVITTIIVTIVDLIVDIFCCRCHCGGYTRTSTRSGFRSRGFGRHRRTGATYYYY